MKLTDNTWEALVPSTKHDAVTKALCTAFGSARITEVAPLVGGGSTAIVLRIVVDRRPYVLRIIQHIHGLNDPARQFACLQAASEAGISPPVHYTDAKDAVSITDFITPVPLRQYPGSLLIGLVDAIKAIQNTPLFPPLINYLDGIDGFIQQFKGLGMLPEEAIREHFAYYAQIQEAYPRQDPNLVSSHNDLNPRNILFDGQRLWIIDWETAFRNDLYADLANVANFFFRDEPASGEPGAEEEIYLRSYFGDSLNEYHRARFFLMRQVGHMFYAMLLALSAASRSPSCITWDTTMDTPRLQDFHQRFAPSAAAQDPLTSLEGVFLYAKVRLNETLHFMKTPRFAEAIRRIG